MIRWHFFKQFVVIILVDRILLLSNIVRSIIRIIWSMWHSIKKLIIYYEISFQSMVSSVSLLVYKRISYRIFCNCIFFTDKVYVHKLLYYNESILNIYGTLSFHQNQLLLYFSWLKNILLKEISYIFFQIK